MYNCTKRQPVLTPFGDYVVMWSMVSLIPLCSILGVIGNILSFVILKHCSEKMSSFFYIRCLTIFDCLSLIFTLFEFYTTSVVNPLLKVYRFYSGMGNIWKRWGTCQLTTYLAFTARTMSVWTIVIFTVERSIGIKFPMVSLKLSTIRCAKIIIAVLVVMSMLCNITWIFSFEKRTSPCNKAIVCRNRKFMLHFRILDFVMLSVVPSIIILVSNVIIIISLRQRRKLSLVAFEEPKNKKRDKKIAIQLLTVSFVFIGLTLPSCASTIINTMSEWHGGKAHTKGALANFYHISMLLFNVNLSINFALYCFVGKNFRSAAYSLLCCRLDRMRQYRDALFDTVTEPRPATLQSSINRGNTGPSSVKEGLLMTNLSLKSDARTTSLRH